MEIDVMHMVYFSPTGTTKKITDQIAAGFSEAFSLTTVESYDLTPASSRARLPIELRGGLAFIGSPVYCGRVPSEVAARLARISAFGVLAVVVAVYGNRAYDDSIMELGDLAIERGFRVVAAGAFIGEHSFSREATPIARGRPDKNDLQQAKEFGKAVSSKIKAALTSKAIPMIELPGTRPYRESPPAMGISPISQQAVCTRCGKCAEICPRAAITNADPLKTDRELCILCCACVKECPTGARMFVDKGFLQIAKNLAANCGNRKEPETYL